MTRNTEISKKIYKSHIKLYRFINDEFIFSKYVSDLLREDIDKIQNFKKGKLRFDVPKDKSMVISRRKRSDFKDMIEGQIDQGLFAKNIVMIVSRMEAHLQDCMLCALSMYPQKLSLLVGDKFTITASALIKAEDTDTLLKAVVTEKCNEAMFRAPKEYLSLFQKVMSIKIPEKILNEYIEIKASRDILVHGNGNVNDLYILKAGKLARASNGEPLEFDRRYYKHVVTRMKKLSGAIVSAVEEKYG